MPDANNDGRLVFDLLSAVLLLLVAILGAYLPKYLASSGSLQSGTASSLAFHLGNMLSGGVMLSAGFCHLLADALRQLPFIGRFPIAPFLAAVGYLTTLLADQLVQILTTDAEQTTTPSQLPTPYDGGYTGGGGSTQDRDQDHLGGSFSPLPEFEAPGVYQAQGLLNPGLGMRRWGAQGGYSRLADKQQQQDVQEGVRGSDNCTNGAASIEMIMAHGNGSCHGHSRPASATAAAAGGGLARQPSSMCCHAPQTCPCCLARSSSDAEGSRHALGGLNPAAAASPAGFTRRPGSAGGLAPAGLGLGVIARTRSLTGPLGLPSPAAAAAATAAAAAATAAAPAATIEDNAAVCLLASGSPRSISASGLHPRSPKAAFKSSGGLRQQQQQHGPAASATTAAAAHGSSPANGSVHLLDGDVGDAHQLQQQGQHQMAAAGAQQQQQQPSQHMLQQQQSVDTAANNNLCLSSSSTAEEEEGDAVPLLPSWQQQQCGALQQQKQQSQQQQNELQRAGSSVVSAFLQQQQQPHCCCCCSIAAKAGVAQPDMTEASTVARVAGHLELEVLSTSGSHSHAHFQVFLSHRPLSFATSVLLACALCIHSILEGLALGAQQSMQATEDIMLAIAAHKGLAAYALGASIVESKASSSKFWLIVGLFAAATPLGIAIGYASSVLGHGPVSAAMSALASGTFLYVALNEVIPKELEHPDGHRLAKVAALLLGFGLMSLLAVWA